MFAAVDTTGRLDIWNLNADTEVPTAGTCVQGSPALNRVSWSPSGTHIVTGDEFGRVWVYEIGEVCCFFSISLLIDCFFFYRA